MIVEYYPYFDGESKIIYYGGDIYTVDIHEDGAADIRLQLEREGDYIMVWDSHRLYDEVLGNVEG